MIPAKRHSEKKNNFAKKQKSTSPTTIPEKNFSDENALNDKTDIFKIFPVKDKALEFIEKNNNLKLFSQDKTENNGSKQFIATTYDKIYMLSKNKKSNLYENYENNDKVKLILDIDYKIKKNKDTDYNDMIDDILIRCIDLVNDKVAEHTDIVPKIIVLKSCREDKLSAHVIYQNIHFESIQQLKCFMMTLNSPLIESKIIDPNVYRVGCMRLLWNSKLGKSNILEYEDCDFLGDSRYIYTDDYSLFMDSLITNISDDSELIKIDILNVQKKKKNTKANYIYLNNDPNIEKQDIETIKKYLDILDPKRADDYNDWIKVGMCIYNSNNSEDGFKLWDSWSKTYDNYCQNVNRWKWNSFTNLRKTMLTIDTLKYYAKLDNPELFAKINHKVIDKPKYDSIKVEQTYLLDKKEIIKSSNSTVSQNICNWMNNKEIKTLAIKSPYNTGKTTLISNVLREFKPKRVLFITHRQSLTNELYGTFKKFGFCNYMNGSFDARKLICQIESLHKITDSLDPFYYNSENIAQSFDLVILDEIESINYHFTSPTISNKQQTFEYMCEILRISNKILALDGDFHNRSFDLIDSLGKSIIIENTIKKDPKKFIFTNNIKSFDKSIDDQLKKKHKIVIVSMSSNIATKYYEKYKTKYKCILHCSKSDDSMKELLKDVESNWANYDLVIYSPSVQSGVSFDIPYFDKMYVILSSKSCSPRDVSQMTHRVRQFKDNNVHVYLNSLPYKENADFYTHCEIREYVGSIYNLYTKQNNGIVKYNDSLYSKILTHNELENINKAPYYFVPILIKCILNKGNTYEYDKTKKIKNKAIDFNKESVLQAEDIDAITYRKYMKLQERNEATSDQKFAIEKYMYKKSWGVDVIDNDFMDKWFRKTYVLHNLKYLNGDDKLDDLMTIDEHNRGIYLQFDKAKQKQRLDIITELIVKMGFSLDNIGSDSKLEKDNFVKNMKDCLKSCKLFIDRKLVEPLFGMKSKNLVSVRSFMGFVNSLLKHWGLCIVSLQKSKWLKSKKVNLYEYSLEYYCNINIYL